MYVICAFNFLYYKPTKVNLVSEKPFLVDVCVECYKFLVTTLPDAVDLAAIDL